MSNDADKKERELLEQPGAISAEQYRAFLQSDSEAEPDGIETAPITREVQRSSVPTTHSWAPRMMRALASVLLLLTAAAVGNAAPSYWRASDVAQIARGERLLLLADPAIDKDRKVLLCGAFQQEAISTISALEQLALADEPASSAALLDLMRQAEAGIRAIQTVAKQGTTDAGICQSALDYLRRLF